MQDLSQPKEEAANENMSGGEEDFDQDDWDNYGEEENEYGDVVAEATK